MLAGGSVELATQDVTETEPLYQKNKGPKNSCINSVVILLFIQVDSEVTGSSIRVVPAGWSRLGD